MVGPEEECKELLQNFQLEIITLINNKGRDDWTSSFYLKDIKKKRDFTSLEKLLLKKRLEKNYGTTQKESKPPLTSAGNRRHTTFGKDNFSSKGA
jgi:hypothetical protein